jgi:hypothetical protein
MPRVLWVLFSLGLDPPWSSGMCAYLISLLKECTNPYILFTVILVMRTYALYGRDRTVLITLSVIAAVCRYYIAQCYLHPLELTTRLTWPVHSDGHDGLKYLYIHTSEL